MGLSLEWWYKTRHRHHLIIYNIPASQSTNQTKNRIRKHITFKGLINFHLINFRYFIYLFISFWKPTPAMNICGTGILIAWDGSENRKKSWKKKGDTVQSRFVRFHLIVTSSHDVAPGWAEKVVGKIHAHYNTVYYMKLRKSSTAAERTPQKVFIEFVYK